EGLVLAPIDRATIELVWGDRGYPAGGAYRNYHGLTTHHHRAWANDGSAYSHERALGLAREHAADFVARVRARLRRDGAGLPGGVAAARQLLALQASDWAFLVSRELAAPYARERLEGHLHALQRSLAGEPVPEAQERNLAVHADPALLWAP